MSEFNIKQVELFCPFCDGPVDVLEAQGNYWNTPDFWCSCQDENCAGYHSEPEGQWHTQEDAIRAWMKAGRKMTSGRYLKMLTEYAQEYRPDALSSIGRNRHMNDLSEHNIRYISTRPQIIIWRVIDALLTDFINFVAARMGVDYGLNSYDVYWPKARNARRKIDEEKDLVKKEQMEEKLDLDKALHQNKPIS